MEDEPSCSKSYSLLGGRMYLAIIPARGGSKGIPKKNIKDFCGKPMIAWTIEAAQKSKYISNIVISTDDQKIAEVCEGCGVDVPWLRPIELAQDNTPSHPVIVHALESFEKSNPRENIKGIVLLQPTSPLRNSEDIDEAIELFESNKSADSLVSIVKVPHNMVPESINIKIGDFIEPLQAKSSVRRQDKKEYYARNGAAIYITKYEFAKDFILGNKIVGYEMSKLKSIDIDDEEDFKLAEVIGEKQFISLQ
jgi:CMP-N,N'-diacetyllegionaminic acid synthase